MYNTKSEPQCILWTVVNNSVSVLAHQVYYNKCTTQMQEVNRGNCVGTGGEGNMGIPYTFAQFYCKSKTVPPKSTN